MQLQSIKEARWGGQLRSVANAATGISQDWQKITAPWKAELERSRAFEKKLGNPSRNALAGCAAELTADAAKLFKSYKKDDYNEVLNAVTGDPIAQLLLSRLAICYACREGVPWRPEDGHDKVVVAEQKKTGDRDVLRLGHL